jgi:hypothetical protein
MRRRECERARVRGFDLSVEMERITGLALGRLGKDLHFRLQAHDFAAKFISQPLASLELRRRVGRHRFKSLESRFGLLALAVRVLQRRHSRFHGAHQTGDATRFDHGPLDHFLLTVERLPPGRQFLGQRIEGLELIVCVPAEIVKPPVRLGEDLDFHLQPHQLESKFISQSISSLELRRRFGGHFFKPSESRLGQLEQVFSVLQLRQTRIQGIHQAGDATGIVHGPFDHLLLSVEGLPFDRHLFGQRMKGLEPLVCVPAEILERGERPKPLLDRFQDALECSAIRHGLLDGTLGFAELQAQVFPDARLGL